MNTDPLGLTFFIMGHMVIFLTPAKQGQLDHVGLDVCVEHFHQKQVQMHSFNGHPGEAAQQAVLDYHSHKYTEAIYRHTACQVTEQKANVEEEQGGTQGHVDAVGGVWTWDSVWK